MKKIFKCHKNIIFSFFQKINDKVNFIIILIIAIEPVHLPDI